MSRPKATQLWSTASKKSTSFVEDSTWMSPFCHSAKNNTVISFKAGNKDYALKAVSDPEKKSTISELQLKRKYSTIFPFDRHYFHVKVLDGSKSYNPETQTVLDIGTALNFFGGDPIETRRAVGEKVRHLVLSWNEKTKGKSPQSRSHFSDYSVLSQINFNDRKGASQTSHFVLIISNWHFVRDNIDRMVCLPCKPENCNISIKLSSTTFRGGPTELAQGGGTLETEIRPDEEFFFDKNGIIIPYSAFISLLNDRHFTDEYLPAVKKEFEKLCGSPETGDKLEANSAVAGDDDVAAAAKGVQEKKAKSGKAKKSKHRVLAEDPNAEPESEEESLPEEAQESRSEEIEEDVSDAPSSSKRTRTGPKSK